MNGRPRRARRLLVAGFGGVLAVWALLVITVAVYARVDARGPADAIVVLGAAQWAGRPSPVLRARLDHAAQLWRDGRAPLMVVTGGVGTGDTLSEADVGRRYLMKQGIPDSAIRDQLITLLIAGHETTAIASSWALYELCRHPAWLERLRDGIATLGADPDPAALAALPDLEAVCRETLRLHPVAPEFFRTVRDRYRFRGWEIPAGITLAGVILSIHRDPALYPDPERFRPERFLERRFAPHEFAAFGGSHRHCLGSAFALHEMCVILGTLLSRVDVRLAQDRPLRTVRRNILLAPEKGVPLVVSPLAR